MSWPVADCVSSTDPQLESRSIAVTDPAAAGMVTLASLASVTERSRPAPVLAVALATTDVVWKPVQVHTPLPVEVSSQEPPWTVAWNSFFAAS